jgi:alanine racemase
MRVVTRVVGVRSVAAGEGVGYSHATVIRRATRLALVPMGYADGLPRIAGPHARMLVGDRVARVVGRISMDQAILDVGDRPVRIGDPVTVIGDGRDEAPTVADWARWSGTIPHEILTGIGARVVRRTVGGAR